MLSLHVYRAVSCGERVSKGAVCPRLGYKAIATALEPRLRIPPLEKLGTDWNNSSKRERVFVGLYQS